MNTLSIIALTAFVTVLFLVIVALGVIVVYLLKKQLQRNEFKKATQYGYIGAVITAYVGILGSLAFTSSNSNAVVDTSVIEEAAKATFTDLSSKFSQTLTDSLGEFSKKIADPAQDDTSA